MLLKTQNLGLPVELWSPTGQRSHHLIGLLPETLQAFLLLMSFKAERHLTCMPTLWAELIYKEKENSLGGSPCLTFARCQISDVTVRKQKCKLCNQSLNYLDFQILQQQTNK